MGFHDFRNFFRSISIFLRGKLKKCTRTNMGSHWKCFWSAVKIHYAGFEAYVTHHSDKKKSVGNINKKFSLSFSLNIFHRDFESILLFICHGLKKKTLRLPLSYRENPIFAGKKLFSWQLFAKTSFILMVDFLLSSVTLHTAWSDVIIILQCILETIIHRGSFI